MAVSERTFGVEIECGHPNLNYATMGAYLRQKKIPIYGNVGFDGSGLEVRTPILKGEAGYEALETLMNTLAEAGCFVTRQDGMHVHIGAPDFLTDEKACQALAETWYCNQAIITSMVSAHRFNHIVSGTSVCAQITKKEAETWGRTLPREGRYRYGEVVKTFGTKYKALNMTPIRGKKTVEFRLHEGCLDPRKAIAWVKFCQGLVDFAATEKEVIKCESKIALLRNLGLPQEVVTTLRTRQPLMPEKERVFAKRA